MKLPELKKALQQHGLKPEGGKAAMAALLSEVAPRPRPDPGPSPSPSPTCFPSPSPTPNPYPYP